MGKECVSATAIIGPRRTSSSACSPTRRRSRAGRHGMGVRSRRPRRADRPRAGVPHGHAPRRPPVGDYQTANRVRVLDRPAAIAWETGYETADGELRFGGWVWRYDLEPTGPATTRVTLSYDGLRLQPACVPPLPALRA